MKNNRKAVEKRQMDILNLVREKGEVKVEEIAKEFQISLMTVRRDLQFLEQEKFLARTHGGAISLEKAYTVVTKDERIAYCRDRISEYASKLVEDGDTLFINGSRTALNLLNYVTDKKINVITNNCWGIGTKYADGISIHYTGGEVKSNVMVGEYVMRNLLTMTADKSFLGCAAVYDGGEFRYDIPTEIGINEAMVSHTTKELYILADHSKIQDRDSRGTYYGSCTYDSCTLITDDYADKEVVERLRMHGIKVIIVPTR